MQRIAVLGGTGFVGHAVCEHWTREAGAGSRILVPSRRPAHDLPLRSLPTVDLVRADVHDEADLHRVLQGCDALVHLVAILQGSPAAFERVHVRLPERVAAACQRAGVRRVVHISALGVAPDAPSNYLRSKAAGERVWSESGLALTVLRPSVIFGARDRLLNLFASLQSIAPVVPLAGAQAMLQPVWVEDVARAVVHCLQHPHTAGQVIECAGPEVMSLAELVRLAGRLSGHERPVFPLPGALATLQAVLMEMLPGEPLMSRDNLASLRVRNVASGTLAGLRSLGIEPAAVEQVAAAYLGARQGPGRFVAWRSRRR